MILRVKLDPNKTLGEQDWVGRGVIESNAPVPHRFARLTPEEQERFSRKPEEPKPAVAKGRARFMPKKEVLRERSWIEEFSTNHPSPLGPAITNQFEPEAVQAPAPPTVTPSQKILIDEDGLDWGKVETWYNLLEQHRIDEEGTSGYSPLDDEMYARRRTSSTSGINSTSSISGINYQIKICHETLKPARSKLNGYVMFLHHMRKKAGLEAGALGINELILKFNEDWQMLSDAERKLWKDRAKSIRNK